MSPLSQQEQASRPKQSLTGPQFRRLRENFTGVRMKDLAPGVGVSLALFSWWELGKTQFDPIREARVLRTFRAVLIRRSRKFTKAVEQFDATGVFGELATDSAVLEQAAEESAAV